MPHTRAVPEEWPALTERAAKLIPQASHDRTFGRLPIYRLTRSLNEVPRERREANYYFGLGEIICNVAKNLRNDEELHAKTVAKCAFKMVDLALKSRTTIPMDEPFRPQMHDLDSRIAYSVFMPLAVAAQRQLPPWHRALTGTLNAMRVREEPPMTAGQRRHDEHLLRRLARTGYPAAESVTINAFTGAMGVFCTLLTGHNPETAESESHRRQYINLDEVERVRKSQAFTGSAKLRIDEFADGAGWTGQGDTLRFDRNYLKTAPPAPMPGEDGLFPPHQGRHECPALQAEGFALEVARIIVPEIIDVASQIVPGEHFKVNYPE